jgi:hypothetical protein
MVIQNRRPLSGNIRFIAESYYITIAMRHAMIAKRQAPSTRAPMISIAVRIFPADSG